MELAPEPRTLKAIARETGLPPTTSKTDVDGLGLFDSVIDALGSHSDLELE